MRGCTGFKKFFASDEMGARLGKAREQQRKCELVSVPTLIVDGKHSIEPARTGGLQGMISALDIVEALPDAGR